jgi:transcriptional regulator with XRE-family HTH domain
MTSPDGAARRLIAGNVRAELARRGLSGADLATRLNLDPSYVHRRLSGTVGFKGEELLAVAEALDVPVNRLTDG